MLYNVKQHINDEGPFDIIGDIHGCLDELLEMLIKLGYQQNDKGFYHPEGRKIVSVGDLNDRGPHNINTIRIIMDLVENGQGHYVYGNHCNKFYRYLLGRNVQQSHGLEYTVAEFEALADKEYFRNKYIAFYQNALPYLILDKGNLVVSHAGLKEAYIGRADRKVEKFCLYGDITGETDEQGHPIRKDWFLSYRGKAVVVFGHTAVLHPYIINNTIDIDTGCVFGGALTAFRYPEKTFIQIPSMMPRDEEQLEKMTKNTRKIENYIQRNKTQ